MNLSPKTKSFSIIACTKSHSKQVLAFVFIFVVHTLFAQPEPLPQSQTIQCISLHSLANRVEAQSQAQSKSGIELLFQKFSRVSGFIVDTTTNDVILLAMQEHNWPATHLDDFITCHSNVFLGNSPPYCSLDPDQTDVSDMSQILKEAKESEFSDIAASSEWAYRRLKREWGAQHVVIEGVPKDSRFARKMVDVDYHMKKVSLGLYGIDVVPSYIDQVVTSGINKFVQTGKSDYPISVTRFWFHIQLPPDGGGDSQHRFPTFSEAEGIVLIEQCPIVLLTEQQLLYAKNKMGDRQSSDRPAQEFADDFTEHFPEISRTHHEYAELDNLFRMIAVLRAMQFRECYTQAGWNDVPAFDGYQPIENKTMSDTISGLVNFRTSQTVVMHEQSEYKIVVCPIVCGGVDMYFPVTESQFSSERKVELSALKKLVLATRPNDSTTTWQVTVPDSLLK